MNDINKSKFSPAGIASFIISLIAIIIGLSVVVISSISDPPSTLFSGLIILIILILSILSIVMGAVSLKSTKVKGFSRAGIILGIIAIVVSVAPFIIATSALYFNILKELR